MTRIGFDSAASFDANGLLKYIMARFCFDNTTGFDEELDFYGESWQDLLVKAQLALTNKWLSMMR